MLSTRLGQLTGQHVGGRHRQGRTLPRHQGHTECGIPDEGNAASRPTIDLDLADAVEIEVRCAIQFGKDAPTFPFPATIRVA